MMFRHVQTKYKLKMSYPKLSDVLQNKDDCQYFRRSFLHVFNYTLQIFSRQIQGRFTLYGPCKYSTRPNRRTTKEIGDVNLNWMFLFTFTVQKNKYLNKPSFTKKKFYLMISKCEECEARFTSYLGFFFLYILC